MSVLLPVRNGAAFLDAALRSLARQSQPAEEVVVVDDASSDATPRILDAWEHRLPLVRRAGPGQGIVPALNLGLAACRGDWVARMDADDAMHPRRLERQRAHVAAHPDVGVCGTEVCSFPRRHVSEKRRAYDAWLSSLHTPEEHAQDMFVEATLAHPTALIRRAALESLGGYQDHPWPEDYDLWLRLHRAGVRFAKPSGTLHFWREGAQRLSRTSGSYSRDAIRACRLHHLVQHARLRERPVVIMGAGIEGKAAGRVLLREGVTVLAHVDADPRKVGGRLMGEGGVRVLAPAALPGLLRGPPQPLLVVAVGTAGARPGLRAELSARGLQEGTDAVLVA